MCGIFGFVAAPGAQVDGGAIRAAVADLFRLSESRGKEAAGLATRCGDTIRVYKQPIPASRMIRTRRYRRFIQLAIPDEPWVGTNGNGAAPVAVVGHSRLVTNGRQTLNQNNQPVIAGHLVGVHNGIVVNDGKLWARYPTLERQSDVDTEILLRLLGMFQTELGDVADAVRETFKAIEGSASVAVLSAVAAELILATNTGSLYLCTNEARDVVLFTSERYIMDQALERPTIANAVGPHHITHVEAGQAGVLDLRDLRFEAFSLRQNGHPAPMPAQQVPAARIIDELGDAAAARAALPRCSRCVLPETFPLIEFDADGICNYCREHEPRRFLGRDALEDMAARHRRTDGQPDCIIGVSGGRDSCFGLHYVKTQLGLNPLAFTYDWGMITDLARRNQARLCGQLGIEHILVSADIKAKRRNIRRNIEAWLKRPELGMIPLFMAGDKEYFYHAQRLRQQTGLDLLFLCWNYFEKTYFKSGFCGVREGPDRIYSVPLSDKARMAWYYGRAFLLNPSYLNPSVLDTVRAFGYSYLMQHDFTFLFRYIPWNEEEIMGTLQAEYDWESATDTDTSWRIGDGTAAFYNYIYLTVAGFTEHDTFRSNQIREGVLSRDQALRLLEKENQPRLESVRWYAEQIGFDPDEALAVINAVPKLYAVD